MKRYELIKSDTIKKYGKTLYRVKYNDGTLGGYIASEKCLPHNGTGMVYDGAYVFGGVIHGGKICGCEIHDGTYLNGVMRGGVWKTTPLQIQGSKHFLNASRPRYIQIGRYEYTVDEWKTVIVKICKENGYTSKQIEEYGHYIDLFEQWFKLHGMMK